MKNISLKQFKPKNLVIFALVITVIQFHNNLQIITFVNGLDNGVGLTPPMGWNTWNHYACNINQTVIIQNAQLLISLGLANKGYKYVNLDDCWQITRNSSTGQIIQDFKKFPNGMKSLAKYLHSANLLFGLYSDAGQKTCQGRPGGYGYQKIDANTYASWGVDYLKYDNCHNEGISAKIRYPIMRDALNASGRAIYFSMCNWGFQKPWLWAQNVSNSWRTTLDIKNDWQSVMLNFQQQQNLYPFAKPGAWNDPDMLQVGNKRLTHDEQQSHFALWALLKSPLLIGCSLKDISKQSLQVLSNDEIIAVNQDPLGKQGRLLSKQKNGIFGTKQIWFGELSKLRVAFILFNKSSKQADFNVDLKQFKPVMVSQLNQNSSKRVQSLKFYRLRDIIKGKDLQIPSDLKLNISNVRKHAVQMFVLQFIEQPQKVMIS